MNSLVSLFLDVFIFLNSVKSGLKKGVQPTLDEIKIQVMDMLNAIDLENANDSGLESNPLYSKDIYDSAKFALIAYIDETLFSSSWEFSEDWMKSPLQKELANTVCAGQEFFDKLESVSKFTLKEERDLAELYNYCLTLGFQGVYYQNKDKLNSISRELYGRLVKYDDSQAVHKQEFPIAVKTNEYTSFRLSNRAMALIYGVSIFASVALILVSLISDLHSALTLFNDLY
jgi:type VI secretion system protein ImpK